MSIVDYMKKMGRDSSFSARKKMASEYGISDYRGSAVQNNNLLKAMQNGKFNNISNTPQANVNNIKDNNSIVPSIDTSKQVANQVIPNANAITVRDNIKSKNYEPYRESMEVSKYRNRLRDIERSKPENYVSRYENQIQDILNGLASKKAFDVSTDNNYRALYENMKESYLNAGNKAMRDTIGNISSMTGGYGNSYAQTVGSQAYDNYLQNLNARNIDLANMAYGMYRDDIDRDYRRLGAYNDLERYDYSRYRDEVGDYLKERDYLTNRYYTEHSIDYSKYKDRLGQDNFEREFEYKKAQDLLAQKNYEDERDYKREQDRLQMEMAMQKMSSGGRAGMSGSGGRKSRGRMKVKTDKAFSKQASMLGGYAPSVARISMELKKGIIDNHTAYSRLLDEYESGLLTESQFDSALKYSGIDEEKALLENVSTNNANNNNKNGIDRYSFESLGRRLNTKKR